MNVMGRAYIYIRTCAVGCTHTINTAAAAEKALEITRSLIDLAKIESGLSKELLVCVIGLSSPSIS